MAVNDDQMFLLSPSLLFFRVNIISLSFKGLAKRVRARLLLASTSEIYGGKPIFFSFTTGQANESSDLLSSL